MSEERARRNDFEEKLNKAQYLIEESEDIKNKLEFELDH